MRVAFITEMGFVGKIPANHINMRTEFAWMFALDADHINIHSFSRVADYDAVFIIFPKGRVFLSAEGTKMGNEINPVSVLLDSNIVDTLKSRNKKVFYVQEGPHWWYTDYELVDQINFYNMLSSCDAIFAHNSSDVPYYKGLIPNKPVYCMPSLMIDESVSGVSNAKEDKVIVGGNCARWYGGFESYVIAQDFNVPIWVQTSHCTREGEGQLMNQLPRVMWSDWMKLLSSFKYAVHLMPTVAAGTFSLNCAYFGIPCIGNIKVDTQRLCHPSLSVDVEDLHKARELVNKLKSNSDFYLECSNHAKEAYTKYYSKDAFLKNMNICMS